MIRIAFDSVSEASQLHSLRYHHKDAQSADADIIAKTEDKDLCSILTILDQSYSMILLLKNHGEDLFFINQAKHQILKRANAHTLYEVDEIDLLPQVGAKVYSGSLNGVVLKSGYSPYATLPIGSKQEVEKAIEDLQLTKKYRRVCYDLFSKEMEKQGYVESNTTLSTSFFYMVPRRLFHQLGSYSWRMYNYNGKANYFSSFEELTSDLSRNDQLLHIGIPVRRHITCSINTESFRENEFYRERMENCTTVDGTPLTSTEYGTNDSIYHITTEGLESLKYTIQKEDKEENVEIELIISTSDAMNQLEKQCTSRDAPAMTFSDDFIRKHIHSLVRL